MVKKIIITKMMFFEKPGIFYLLIVTAVLTVWLCSLMTPELQWRTATGVHL